MRYGSKKEKNNEKIKNCGVRLSRCLCLLHSPFGHAVCEACWTLLQFCLKLDTWCVIPGLWGGFLVQANVTCCLSLALWNLPPVWQGRTPSIWQVGLLSLEFGSASGSHFEYPHSELFSLPPRNWA